MIIFAKSSKDRKKEFRLITTINEIDNKLLVKKRAAQSSARGHLLSIVSNYKKIEPYFKEVKVVKPKLINDVLVFPYVDGVNLLDEFTQYYLNDEEGKAIRLLHEFKQVLDNISTVKYDVGKNKEFTRIFGKFKSGSEECIDVGCLDLNLDNLIRKKDKLYLIDYEWVFDTPLPSDFVYFRTLLYCFAAVKEVLESKFTKEYPLVKIWPGVLVPKKIYDEEFPSLSNLERFSKFEMNFQSYVREIGDSGSQKFYKPMELSESSVVNAFTHINNLESSVNNLQGLLKIKEKELKGKETEIRNVYSSKAWKTSMKVKNLKNIFTGSKGEK